MPTKAPVNLWTSAGHAGDYLGRADSLPHRREGESTLLEFIPAKTRRVLDLGTGDGRLLALVKAASTAQLEAVALDFSPAMLSAAGERFAGDSSVTIVNHNLDHPLPALGKFDAVVSSFAIHHLVHERKRELYTEIYGLLNAGGVFCNLEHVASPTPRLHEEFLYSIGYTPETEDPSNKLLDLETQLQWLREIGFVDVDCHWKWRELALLVGRKP
ncbi:MAG: class I SAM-dependent methyltransferase [Candidatus Sulfotelmatobacter sp.]